MSSWGSVGETFDDHSAQDDHFWGPNGQNLEKPKFLKDLGGGPRIEGTGVGGGNMLVPGGSRTLITAWRHLLRVIEPGGNHQYIYTSTN